MLMAPCIPLEETQHARGVSLRHREHAGDAAHCLLLPLLELVLVQDAKLALCASLVCSVLTRRHARLRVRAMRTLADDDPGAS